MSDAFLMVTTTVESLEEGRALAHQLVGLRLAACVQILPIESVYRWEDAVENASEHLLLCKIAAADYSTVEGAIRQNHAYDVPEIIAMPIATGAASYLHWLAVSTTRPA